MSKVIESIGWWCCFLIVSVVYWLMAGYIGSCLWGWFVVKIFGLPPLSIMQALGLSLTVYFFTGVSHMQPQEKIILQMPTKETNELGPISRCIGMLIFQVMILGTAYVVKMFV